MGAINDMLVYLNDPLNWTNPGGILEDLGQHLYLAAGGVVAGAIVAWPLGLWLGHRGRGGGLIVVLSNISLAIPVLALLTILPLTFIGFGAPSIITAMAIFAIPPLLANAYTGVTQVDPEVIDAARGMGLSGPQVMARVELPLAVPYLAAGLRTAAVQTVATVSLAALVGGGTLGAIVNQGFGEQNRGVTLAGGLLVALLALTVEGLMALLQRAATPRGIRRRVRRRRALIAAETA